MSGSLENDFETWYSPENVNANYEFFLDNNFVGGSICFGYILSTDETELLTNEGAFHRQTISVCTHGEAYNKFNGTTNNIFNDFCKGRLPTNHGNHFKVMAGFNKVQITSYSQKDF